MGLTSLFEFRDVARPPRLELVECLEEGADPQTLAFMLDAHQRLAEVSSDNQRAFAQIEAELRRALVSRSKSRPTS